jgi:hypothetical protein
VAYEARDNIRAQTRGTFGHSAGAMTFVLIVFSFLHDANVDANAAVTYCRPYTDVYYNGGNVTLAVINSDNYSCFDRRVSYPLGGGVIVTAHHVRRVPSHPAAP